MRQFKFTSESVTEGHPDKVCDQIADAILDDILESDPAGRVACEVATSTGLIVILGEITTSHYCKMSDIARRTLDRIGYANSYGFTADSCAVLVSIDEQSPDIAQGVAQSVEARAGSSDPLDAAGAGDQGLMFGYASTESERVEQSSFMPLPIQLAHQLARRMSHCRKQGLMGGLLPDGKSQVTLTYEDHKPVTVDSVLLSTQHLKDLGQDNLKRELFEHVVTSVIPEELCPGQSYDKVEFLVNPTGSFVKGGPEADSGLTGRKLIVDTYGGMARHGGGAFSGKDPSKVDRCASYYARYVAKNLVAAGVAERLELQVSYAIGRAKPMGLMVQTFGTSKVDEQSIEQLLATGEVFDFRPLAIIKHLDLLKPRYAPVAAYGHFGRCDLNLPWERLDKVDAVKQALGI